MIAEAIQRGKSYLKVFASRMAYIETGNGDPAVFLHGNPTSSYLWRNVLPHLEGMACCVAPDLIGMGDSEKLPQSGPDHYTFAEHRRYLDELLSSLEPRHVVLIGHDWGSVLAFDWARRNPTLVRGIAFMEPIVQPLTWDRWSPEIRSFFEQIRSEAGEQMILEENQFIESILPRRIMRKLTDTEMEAYRRPFRDPGEGRRPMLTWPRQLPIDGQPPETVEVVESNAAWLASSPVPKLFINSDPGTMSAEERALCRSWPNTTEVTVRGLHFIQEDSPDEIGAALANWYRTLG